MISRGLSSMRRPTWPARPSSVEPPRLEPRQPLGGRQRFVNVRHAPPSTR
jgi:hypothetical protein